MVVFFILPFLAQANPDIYLAVLFFNRVKNSSNFLPESFYPVGKKEWLCM